jgi:hypothetical protein
LFAREVLAEGDDEGDNVWRVERDRERGFGRQRR